MLDIQFIRDNRDLVAEKAAQKGYPVDITKLLELDEQRRSLRQQIEKVRQDRNEHAAMLKQGPTSPENIAKGKDLKQQLSALEQELEPVEQSFTQLLKNVPNMPMSDVPIGATEDENVIVKVVGEPTKFDFTPKNHWEIAEAKGWIDKERAAKVAGSRFAYLKGDLVRLHMAIVNYAISILTNSEVLAKIAKDAGLEGVSTKPFSPVMPPLMIRTDIYDAMDRLEPRDDRYKIEGEDLWLQGSAEHVLGSMHAQEIIPEAEFPIRYAGYATSFRREAGTYGKDMEGIFRLHQFDKLEMESLTLPEDSLNEHLFMVAIQEYLMSQLGLPYQVIMKCTADIGKPNARGVDIEVWLPGQNKYRETHTADLMTDYQSRRLQTRTRRNQDGQNSVQLVHTNDATVFSQRPEIATIENFQTKEGNVIVPEVLRPFMGGQSEM